MKRPDNFRAVPAIQQLMEDVDHIDVKTYRGRLTLEAFIAGFMSYYPNWIKALYGVRWGFVRLLGMKQKGIPQPTQMRPEDVPMAQGQQASFFSVEAAERGNFWLVSAKDTHLTAYLGVVAKPLDDGMREFSVITLVKYHNWAGPVYFNVIRPFHHIVVDSMARSGLRYTAATDQRQQKLRSS